MKKILNKFKLIYKTVIMHLKMNKKLSNCFMFDLGRFGGENMVLPYQLYMECLEIIGGTVQKDGKWFRTAKFRQCHNVFCEYMQNKYKKEEYFVSVDDVWHPMHKTSV